MKEFGERLRSLRETHNRTQTEVAQAIGIKQTTYSNYETGKREPDFDTFLKICEYFGVGSEVLLPVRPADDEWYIKLPKGSRQPTPFEHEAIIRYIRYILDQRS